jgi:hypothetical protein
MATLDGQFQDGGEKIGTTALARHQNVHVGEDQKIRERLSGDDD